MGALTQLACTWALAREQQCALKRHMLTPCACLMRMCGAARLLSKPTVSHAARRLLRVERGRKRLGDDPDT